MLRNKVGYEGIETYFNYCVKKFYFSIVIIGFGYFMIVVFIRKNER